VKEDKAPSLWAWRSAITSYPRVRSNALLSQRQECFVPIRVTNLAIDVELVVELIDVLQNVVGRVHEEVNDPFFYSRTINIKLKHSTPRLLDR